MRMRTWFAAPAVAALFAFALASGGTPAARVGAASAAAGHYMFVWTGDVQGVGNDFLAVVDADPASPTYGKLLTTLVTDQQTKQIHHTEYVMPASGMLFANDHLAGRTFIFDVRDALHPKIVTSFTDMGGYSHPHSYVRLPNGHVLATFQHAHHDHHDGESIPGMGRSGGLVEIDDTGKLVRSASSADPEFPDALLTPYGLAVIPDVDRVVTTKLVDARRPMSSAASTYQVVAALRFETAENGESRSRREITTPTFRPRSHASGQTVRCTCRRWDAASSASRISWPRTWIKIRRSQSWCGRFLARFAACPQSQDIIWCSRCRKSADWSRWIFPTGPRRWRPLA